ASLFVVGRSSAWGPAPSLCTCILGAPGPRADATTPAASTAIRMSTAHGNVLLVLKHTGGARGNRSDQGRSDGVSALRGWNTHSRLPYNGRVATSAFEVSSIILYTVSTSDGDASPAVESTQSRQRMGYSD